MGEPASKQRHICFVLANRRCVPQKLLEGVLEKASRMGAQTYKYNAFAPHHSPHKEEQDIFSAEVDAIDPRQRATNAAARQLFNKVLEPRLNT